MKSADYNIAWRSGGFGIMIHKEHGGVSLTKTTLPLASHIFRRFTPPPCYDLNTNVLIYTF